MQLEPSQVERFYSIWFALLTFVNEQRKVVPERLGIPPGAPWDTGDALKIRDVLWADDSLRESFIEQNPAGLSADDLALVGSWKHRVGGTFTVLRQLKKYALFLGDHKAVYGVLGLVSPYEEILPFLPCYVKATLLPFGDVIITDGLFVRYNVMLGPGIRRNLEATYRDAKERGAIITSLLPPEEPPSVEEQLTAAGSTDAKVLDAFRTYLFRTGLSVKVVERDLASVRRLAEDYLLELPEPRSLRELGSAEVRGYLTHLDATEAKATKRKQARLSLKRLVRFLRDTERMEYWEAQDALEILKEVR